MNIPGPPGFRTRQRDSRESPSAMLRRAWQEGREPALDSFVAEQSDLTPAELAAMIRVDFDAHWSRDARRQPEEYLRRYSIVAADAESAVDVIYAEYLAREKSGECPELTEYQDRFPEFADVLAEQIRLHLALETFESDPQVDSGKAASSDADANGSPAELSNLDATYEILDQIGSGGMGVVYKARQSGLNRFVALKMVRAIDAGNPELLARFRSEARVVAALHHQNIVQVYDYGQHNDLPYIAMELIAGGSLADRLDGKPWDHRAAAALLVKLAGAVQFAHDHGVIHRDLKPANILVVSDDKELEVKVTDFGLAKFHTDHSAPHTKSIAFLGTPSYMAPEQASGRARDTGPATDIYSLGAILYELLTGQPPFRGESPIETLRLLLSSEPVSVHRFAPHISRDLATICHKCLQVDANKRYASAAELRADLERYLEGKPIQARPIGSVERLWRWCRRNPYLAAALGSIAMLLVTIAAVSTWYSAQLSRELTKTRQAEQAEREANQAAQQRLWNVYLSEATARNHSRQVGQRFAALESVDKAITLLDSVGRNSQRELQLRNAVLSSVVLPDLRTVRVLDNWPGNAYACDMSASADRYVVATLDGALRGYRLSDSQGLWVIDDVEPRVTPVISQNGQFVAAVDARVAKVWRVDASQSQLVWEAPRAQYFSFVPDGEHALYSDPAEGMRLVRVGDGNVKRTIGKGPARSTFACHLGTNRIAVYGAASAQVLALDTGKLEVELPLGPINEARVAWHPSGEYLAVWGSDDYVQLWNVKTGTKALTLPHAGMRARLNFNGDGSVLVSESLWNRRLCAWDVGSGQRFIEVPDFISHACDVAPDGNFLFLTIRDTDAVLIELAAGTCRSLAQSLYAASAFWYKASISPEGRILVFSSNLGLDFWDLQTAQRLLVGKIGTCMAEFDTAGNLVVGTLSGVYRLPRRVESIGDSTEHAVAGMKPSRDRTIVHLGPPERLTGPISPTSLAMSADGKTLLFEDDRGWALKHAAPDAESVRLQTTGDPRRSAVSNDNRFAAAAKWNNYGAIVWDAKSGKSVAELSVGHTGVPHFSPDGRLLALTPDGVTLWDTTDWRRINNLQAQGTTPTGLGLAFSPDSRVLAVGEVNGVLKLVDPRSGNEWARLARWDVGVASIMAFSPDQRWLVTSSIHERSPAQVWDIVAMRRELAIRGIDFPADVLRSVERPLTMAEQLEITLDFPNQEDSSPTPGNKKPTTPGDDIQATRDGEPSQY